MARQRDPFDVTLTDEERRFLAHWLTYELQKALDARALTERQVETYHQWYEQARMRPRPPWPDAADLTSYLASEKVDSLQARILRTIWTDPMWIVEGWGEASNRAAFVEEFHQWKAEEERLQGVLDRLVLMALIEPRGLLEVAEGTEMRTVRQRMRAAPMRDPVTGGLVYRDGSLQPAQDETGAYRPTQGDEPSVEVTQDVQQRVRTGPVYRILPYRDSLILPGHARDTEQIWGYGKRFWRRIGDLERQAEAGLYDIEAIRRLGRTSDQETTPALDRAQHAVASEEDTTAEKELWELLVLLDLDRLFEGRPGMTGGRRRADRRGERWYLATIHDRTTQLLRFQHDDLERSRFVRMVLFPRPDRVTEGYSFVGHKLGTILAEHTAWRNMAADRAAMQAQAPIKRLAGALWDPDEQPWGPRAILDVRDHREIEPIAVPDVTAPVFSHIAMLERQAERVAGINDIAAGQVSSESRTLGEINMATEQSFIRMDLIRQRCQEALEDLAQIRHAIYERAVAEQPEGIEVPASMLTGLEGRGVSIDTALPDRRITAALLRGPFRFKPRGSVETADPTRQQQVFVQFMQFMPMLLQAFPFLQTSLQSPQAARAMMRQALRVFRVENPQAFLGSASMDWQQQQQVDQMGLRGGAWPGMMGGGMPGPGGSMPAAEPPDPGSPMNGLLALLTRGQAGPM